ncbi:MAG: DUF6529 family protein [Actinomycetota bacterium]|nr:DUF6529 family protein [Actinomycetota bacterium]
MTTLGWRTVRSGELWGVASLLVGAVVAMLLGVLATVHTPTQVPTFGFESTTAMMVWLGSGAGCLALVQLATAVAMFTRGGRLVSVVHRSSGTLAVLLSLPVAYACIWSWGFADQNARVLIHSLTGCLVYGALVTKLLGLHVARTPSWLVPAAGALLLTSVVATTLTSSLWYVAEFGAP